MTQVRQVQFTRASRHVDRTVSYTYRTLLEESTEDYMEGDRLLMSSGILVYKESGRLTQQELEEIEAAQIDVEGKSKREILRNSLFGAWNRAKELDKTNKSFDDFYADYFDKEIEKAKNSFR